MPELPEVESIARGLITGDSEHPSILSKEIVGTSLFWEKSLTTPDPDSFHNIIRHQKINKVYRRGKFLILQLDQSYVIFHLRMSGYIYPSFGLGDPRRTGPINSHDRLYLHFDQDFGLVFTDPRKFGRVWLTPDPQFILGNLGPEPLDNTLIEESFHGKLHNCHRKIKPLLLDQKFIAGLGNIYTDEALFDSQLHPLRSSDSLSISESTQLLQSIRAVLRDGIRSNGASIDWVYRGGSFQNHFKVYQQTGKPCPRCGQQIVKLKVGQRGTHICPSCQKE